MPYPLGILAFFIATSMCGHLLLSRRWPSGISAVERWFLVLAVGFWSIAFAGSIAFHLPVHRIGLVGAPLVILCAVVVGLFGWWTHRRHPPLPLAGPTRGEQGVLALAVGIFIVFFIGIYHALDTKSCLFDSLDELEDPAPEHGFLADRVHGDERYGNVMAVWVFRSFCGPGFDRLAHGFFVGLWFLGSVALGRRFTGRLWTGLPPALILLVIGDVFDCELLNQNVIGAMTATLLALLLHGSYRDLSTMRVFVGAMLVSARYILLMGMGVLAAAALSSAPGRPGPPRWGILTRTSLLFLLFFLPTAHFLLSENSRAGAILAQRFLGFPLHPEWVRSPFLPFPMLVGWPLHFLRSVGLIPLSVALLGWVVMLRERRHGEPWWFLPLYAMPSAAVLFVQENWFEPEKMSIGLVFAPVFTIGVARALDWIARPAPWRRLVVLIAVTGAFAVSWWGASTFLRTWTVPEDPRVRALYPGLPGETPELIRFERERWLDVGWFAFPSSPGILDRFAEKARFSSRLLLGGATVEQQGSVDEYAVAYLEKSIEHREAVLRAIAPPRAGSFRSGTRLVELSLEDNPVTSEEPVRLVPDADAPVLDVSDGRECAMTPVEGLRAGFVDRPLRVLLCRPSPHLAYVILSPPVIPTVEPDGPALPPGTPPGWVFLSPPDLGGMEPTRRVVLRLPEAVRRLILAFYLSLDPARSYVRQATISPDGVFRVEAPRLGRTN